MFWKDIQEEFVSNNDNYNALIMESDMFEDIDPSHIVQHSALKLQAMWKELNCKYAAAKAYFTKSGTHKSDFGNFCFAWADVLYLHKWLEV